MDDDNNVELKVTYKYAQDYNPDYVTGVWGGIGPHGEIICNFYLDRQGVPKQQQFTLNRQTGEQNHVTIDPPDHERRMIRFVSCGIVIDLDTAKSFRKWLDEKIAFLEKHQTDQAVQQRKENT